MTSRYPMTPFPEGWFRVAWSHDLERGGVKPLRWFNRDLVLYRGESGAPFMLDAHCPHVGAHLGHGGRVRGDTIACPFHGWRMNGDGRCIHVPLAKRVPPRAAVTSWHLCEVSGTILAYFHPEGLAPRWTPAPLEAWPDRAWTAPQWLAPWRITTHVQELGENAVDLGHAVFLHDHLTRHAETLDVASDGPILRHRTRHHYRVFAVAEWLGKRVEGTIETQLDGLGRIVVHAKVDAGIAIQHRLVFYPTPVDETHVELHAAVSLRRTKSRILTRALHAKSVREAIKTIDQDIPIWSNKRFEPRPLLVEGEHAMAHYRRWATQFYPSAAPPGPAAAYHSNERS